MSIQNSVELYPSQYLPGQVMTSQTSNVVSKVNKTGSSIGYGMGVIIDGDHGAKLPSNGEGAQEHFVGVTVRESGVARLEAGAPDGRMMGVCSMGAVAVQVADEVTPYEAVYLINTGEDAGKFTTNPNLGMYVVGAKFVSDEKPGGVALLSMMIGG